MRLQFYDKFMIEFYDDDDWAKNAMKSGIFSSCIPRWGFLVRKATPRSSHPRHSTTCRRSSIPSRSFASNAERRRDLLRSRASSTSLSPWSFAAPGRSVGNSSKLFGKSSTASFNTPTAPRRVSGDHGSRPDTRSSRSSRSAARCCGFCSPRCSHSPRLPL